MESITFSTAGADTTAWARVRALNVGPVAGKQAQLAVIGASVDVNAAETVWFVLRDDTRVYRAVEVTLTPTAIRTAPAGSAGGYLCEVDVEGAKALDLLGATGAEGGAKWYVGALSLQADQTVRLDLAYGNSV
jgi:hypothetical protein